MTLDGKPVELVREQTIVSYHGKTGAPMKITQVIVRDSTPRRDAEKQRSEDDIGSRE